jgi:hypothetical protein
MGFVVKTASKVSVSRWLKEDGTSYDFGPRETAIVFPTRELAETHAQRWAALLGQTIDVTVEPSAGE